jgi:methylated-DNA-[protein]-cysteine S-methyltransferase
MTPERFFIFETAGGHCGIAWNHVGITCLRLPAPSRDMAERIMQRHAPDAEPVAPASRVAETVGAVQRYFEGTPTDFSTVVLDLSDESELFRRIYAAARAIGWGRTTTYGALAKEIGAGPEAARAVGQAMAKNPVGLIIPCHRVLAAGSQLGGFSAPGGSSSKLRMLALEGVQVERPETSPPRSGQGTFGF